jgi:N-acetylglucosamine malate deacetylase 1
MPAKKNLSHLRLAFGSKLREIYCGILFNSILHTKSQPLSVNEKSAIVFAPHQDDETFGCGGMIALKRAQKIPVKVVFLTDGRLSKPNDVKPEEIIKIRQQEALNALNFLGVAPLDTHFLGHIDGSLKQLSDEQQNEIITELAQLLKSFNPEEVYVPHSHDRHPDHEATYSLVQKAIVASEIQVELWQYPIWILWQNPLVSHLKVPEISPAYRISIDVVQEQKNRAIASYHSQISTLPPGFLNRFFYSYEIFVKN